jgi:hypothetical protein
MASFYRGDAAYAELLPPLENSSCFLAVYRSYLLAELAESVGKSHALVHYLANHAGFAQCLDYRVRAAVNNIALVPALGKLLLDTSIKLFIRILLNKLF